MAAKVMMWQHSLQRSLNIKWSIRKTTTTKTIQINWNEFLFMLLVVVAVARIPATIEETRMNSVYTNILFNEFRQYRQWPSFKLHFSSTSCCILSTPLQLLINSNKRFVHTLFLPYRNVYIWVQCIELIKHFIKIEILKLWNCSKAVTIDTLSIRVRKNITKSSQGYFYSQLNHIFDKSFRNWFSPHKF